MNDGEMLLLAIAFILALALIVYVIVSYIIVLIEKLGDIKRRRSRRRIDVFLDRLLNGGTMGVTTEAWPILQTYFGIPSYEAIACCKDWLVSYDDRLERGEVDLDNEIYVSGDTDSYTLTGDVP